MVSLARLKQAMADPATHMATLVTDRRTHMAAT